MFRRSNFRRIEKIVQSSPPSLNCKTNHKGLSVYHCKILIIIIANSNGKDLRRQKGQCNGKQLGWVPFPPVKYRPSRQAVIIQKHAEPSCLEQICRDTQKLYVCRKRIVRHFPVDGSNGAPGSISKLRDLTPTGVSID